MKSMQNQNASLTGLQMLQDEMGRQHKDALSSFHLAEPIAVEIAASLKNTGRLMLLGMGASHWVNRIVEPAYRAAGIDATAQVISEYLRAPIAGKPMTQILTSQSGGSGEIIRYLDDTPDHTHFFGLTLDSNSPLAQRLPSLIGAGGVEKAFAATRSILISLALHAAVLEKLGLPQDQLLAALSNPVECDDAEAVELLAKSKCIIFSGRNLLQGVADAGSLCLMELGRIPTLSLEGGQFRHGPFEVLKPGIGVILLAPVEDESDSVKRLASECVAAGMRPVLFDLRGGEAPEGCVTISLPNRPGMGGAAEAVVAMQAALVKAAALMVPEVGTPLRSSKVTNGE